MARPLPLALVPAVTLTASDEPNASVEGTLSEEALSDAYWVLSAGIGASLDDRLAFFREHRLRRGAAPSSVAARIAAIRPFLAAALGRDDDGASNGVCSSRELQRRQSSAGYGIRLPSGEVQALTSQHADGRADLVWVDAKGTISLFDVEIQEYEEDGAADEGGPGK